MHYGEGALNTLTHEVSRSLSYQMNRSQILQSEQIFLPTFSNLFTLDLACFAFAADVLPVRPVGLSVVFRH